MFVRLTPIVFMATVQSCGLATPFDSNSLGVLILVIGVCVGFAGLFSNRSLQPKISKEKLEDLT